MIEHVHLEPDVLGDSDGVEVHVLDVGRFLVDRWGDLADLNESGLGSVIVDSVEVDREVLDSQIAQLLQVALPDRPRVAGQVVHHVDLDVVEAPPGQLVDGAGAGFRRVRGPDHA